MLHAWGSLFPERNALNYEFKNCHRLTARIEHRGRLISREQLKNLLLILHNVPCDKLGLHSLCTHWNLHRRLSPSSHFREQFWTFHKQCEAQLKLIREADFPAGFRSYVRRVAHKTEWIGHFYLELATAEVLMTDAMPGVPVELESLFAQPKRVVVGAIDDLLQHAIRRGLIPTDRSLSKESKLLARQHCIFTSVEPCF